MEKNARRSLAEAEVLTLCVARAVMGISSDREFLAVAKLLALAAGVWVNTPVGLPSRSFRSACRAVPSPSSRPERGIDL